MTSDGDPPRTSLQISGFPVCKERIPEYSQPPLGGEVLKSSHHTRPFVSHAGTSLVTAAAVAYSAHYPLTLTPGSIWLTLVADLARILARLGDPDLLRYRREFGELTLDEVNEERLRALAERAGKALPESLRDFLCWASFRARDELLLPAALAFLQIGDPPPVSDTPDCVVEGQPDRKIWPAGGLPHLELKGWREDWALLADKVSLLTRWGPTSWTVGLERLTRQLLNLLDGNAEHHFLQNLFQVWPRLAPQRRDRHYTTCWNLPVSGWLGTLYSHIRGKENYLIHGPYRKVTPAQLSSWRETHLDAELHGQLQVRAPAHFAHSFESGLGGRLIDIEVRGRTALVGGLLGFHQHPETHSLEPVPGWALVFQERPAPGTLIVNEDPLDAFANLDCLPRTPRCW